MASPAPEVTALLLCEKVLQERDQVLSVIRLVDTFTLSPPDRDPSTGNFLAWMLVQLKRGEASEGSHEVQLAIRHAASGREYKQDPLKVSLGADEDAGINVIVQFGSKLEEEGLYWIRAEVDGESRARISFRVTFQTS